MDGKDSAWKQQYTDIRQGYPLSPYLFILVMTDILHDRHEAEQTHTESLRITGIDFDEVVYADDIIRIAQTAATNRLLAAIESEGSKYGIWIIKADVDILHSDNPAE